MSQEIPNPYEQAQNFNFLTRWLHSFRYKEIYRVMEDLAKSKGDESIRIFEIGSAYGRLFALLNSRFNIEYTGIELYEGLYDDSVRRYGKYPNAKFIHGSALDDENLEDMGKADIVIALETLEHIPDGDVVILLQKIAVRLKGLFVCSVPVEIGPSIALKNIGSALAGYSRHKEYSWRETFYAFSYQLNKLPPHDTGHKGFDWRKLLKNIRMTLNVKKVRRFPSSFLPAWFSTSVFLVAGPAKN